MTASKWKGTSRRKRCRRSWTTGRADRRPPAPPAVGRRGGLVRPPRKFGTARKLNRARRAADGLMLDTSRGVGYVGKRSTSLQPKPVDRASLLTPCQDSEDCPRG